MHLEVCLHSRIQTKAKRDTSLPSIFRMREVIHQMVGLLKGKVLVKHVWNQLSHWLQWQEEKASHHINTEEIMGWMVNRWHIRSSEKHFAGYLRLIKKKTQGFSITSYFHPLFHAHIWREAAFDSCSSLPCGRDTSRWSSSLLLYL